MNEEFWFQSQETMLWWFAGALSYVTHMIFLNALIFWFKINQAYEKCFQNLHYVERHEEHTIAHAVQTAYKKTKVYVFLVISVSISFSIYSLCFSLSLVSLCNFTLGLTCIIF